MTDRNIFEANITLPSDNTTRLLEGLTTLRKYYNDVKLLSNDKGRVYYSVPINDLLEKDITEEDIKLLRNGSWVMDDDNLIKEM